MADSRITYRSRYLSAPQLIPVLDLLLLDPGNPHSVCFQLRQLIHMLDSMSSRDRQPLDRLSSQLHTLDLGVIESDLGSRTRLANSLGTLAQLLLDINSAAYQLADGISLQYFAHVTRLSQSMVSA